MIAAMSNGVDLKQCKIWDGCRVVNIATQSCTAGSEASTDVKASELLCHDRTGSICAKQTAAGGVS